MSNTVNNFLQDELVNKGIRLGECLRILKTNPHFQTLILDHYLKDKSLDQVSLLSHPQMREQRVNIVEDLLSRSRLNLFFLEVERDYVHYTNLKEELLNQDINEEGN